MRVSLRFRTVALGISVNPSKHGTENYGPDMCLLQVNTFVDPLTTVHKGMLAAQKPHNKQRPVEDCARTPINARPPSSEAIWTLPPLEKGKQDSF
jgi:hypothetical protein